MPKPSGTSKPWYAEGLRFSCTQCGNCCTGAPGYVWVTRREIERIAAYLEMGEDRIREQYVYRVGPRLTLAEDEATGDCCFLEHTEDGKRVCSIYPARPLQCRTWPFWNGNLASPQAWARAAQECPGINRGRPHRLVQIEIRRTAKTTEDLRPCRAPSMI